MNILIAIDKFKESMSSFEAAEAIKRGIQAVDLAAHITVFPVSDGGDGLVEALTKIRGGRILTREVQGSSGQSVASTFGVLDNGQTAVIEMAAAAGLHLIPPENRQPLNASTHGVGELIRHCLDRGCRELLIGLGGSATVDLGTGMAHALGVRFLDQSGTELPSGGGHLGQLAEIDLSGLDSRIASTKIIALCDVSHTVLDGVLTFAPQKGVAYPELEILKDGVLHAMPIIHRHCGKEVTDIPGGGAAGGTGAGLVAFLGAELTSGAQYFVRETDLARLITQSDLVITGEGKIDETSLHGKMVSEIAQAANRHGTPVMAFAGSCDSQTSAQLGLAGVFTIKSGGMSQHEAMERGPELLQNLATRVFRDIQSELTSK